MPDGLSLIWPWNPGAIILLLVLCLLYLLGLRPARLRHSQDRPFLADRLSAASGCSSPIHRGSVGGLNSKPVKTRQIVCFFSAIVIAALVLLTPIDTIGSTQLFVVHMFQLVVLTTLCTPLLIFGCSEALLQPLVELPVVRNVVRIFTQPLVASILFNVTFLLWHAPRFYDATIGNASLYHAQVLTIFVLSWLNWWPLIGSVKQLRHMSYPLQMLYAFFDGQPVDIFAFILVFTGVPIYSHYVIPPQLGLSAFADQAAGGALLLIPGLVDLVVMSPLFFRWLGQIEQRTRLADEHRQEEEIELVHLEKQEL